MLTEIKCTVINTALASVDRLLPLTFRLALLLTGQCKQKMKILTGQAPTPNHPDFSTYIQILKQTTTLTIYNLSQPKMTRNV